MTTHKYCLTSRTDTYETGITGSGEQVVMGMHRYPWVVGVFFDDDGQLVRIEKRHLRLEARPNDWYDPTFQHRLSGILREWQDSIDFRESPITISPFFLDDLEIGIQCYAPDLQDFIDNPSDYPEDDHAEFKRDIEQWDSEGNYVFCWSEAYYLDRYGESL